MNYQSVQFYVVLIALMLVSLLLVQFNSLPLEKKIALPHSADYFSNSYVKWSMDENGVLKSKLVADNMVHFNDDKTIHLKQPMMFFYDAQTAPLIINAQSGILSGDGEELNLSGLVDIKREKNVNAADFAIYTSNLNVKTKNSYAQTKESAELVSGKNKTIGIGMNIFFSNPIKLELLSDVHGRYENH